MFEDRQRRARVAVLVVGVALAAVLVGAVTLPLSDGGGPPEDLGEVNGVEYNDSLALTVEDGFNESELDALVARSMARIEVIRGLEFEKQVPVEVISREEYRERRSGERSEAARTWENLRWETLFVVGEDRDATAIIEETFEGGVQGYYSIGDERIVLVSDAEEPTVDTETLVHELVHALQDQRFGIDYNALTTDASMAYESLVEGEAELVPELYFDRCDGAWSCVRLDDETSGTDLEVGIQLGILAPYVQGQEFVDAVRERGGWDAVDELHGRPPESSRQVIHPGSYPDSSPANVTVTDRSTDAWERLGPNEMERRLGVDSDRRGTDTLGEAAIYAMLVHNDVVDPENPMAYEHSFSTGWAGDQLVPYERDGELGYVWETAWETPDDAEQFAAAYRRVLEERGAVGTGADTFAIPDGSFEGAFRVTRADTTVRIVNAPTADALEEVHG